MTSLFTRNGCCGPKQREAAKGANSLRHKKHARDHEQIAGGHDEVPCDEQARQSQDGTDGERQQAKREKAETRSAAVNLPCQQSQGAYDDDRDQRHHLDGKKIEGGRG